MPESSLYIFHFRVPDEDNQAISGLGQLVEQGFRLK
jgi:hypothetical protein